MFIRGFRDVRRRILPVLCVVGIGSLSTLSLFADGMPVKIGSDTGISLPPNWVITASCQDDKPLAPPAGSSLDVNGTTLLLAARPADTTRRAGISLFRANFRSVSPPPLLSGELGTQAETEKLLCMVLGLGFTPTEIHSSRSASAQNTPLLIIEVAAKNASGEERVFTDTAVGQVSPIVRLFSSRTKADPTAADEISSIIQSISTGGTAQTEQGTSNPGAPSAQATPGEISPQTAQLVSDYHDALLMVEGPNGAGSGFLCKLGGQTVAITNAHVVSGNPGFKLTDLKSNVLSVTGGAASVDHDIVKLQVASGAKSFEVMDNLDANIKIGDPVIVLGNAEGARVVRPVEGKVVGVGPDLVEVDAPFVPGNSGSPIVHVATGKVIGVATYLLEKTLNKESRRPVVVETRRFGYRLDSVKVWEPINWQRFYAQSEQVKKIDALSDDFLQLYKDCRKKAQLDPGSYQSPVIQRAVEAFSVPMKQHGRSMSLADKKEMVMRFLGDLRNASRSDLLEFDSRNAYDYFRREVDKQTKLRDSIYDDLSRSIGDKAYLP